MLRKLKWQIPGEPLAAQYNWCQGPVLGRGPAVEKHWSRRVRKISPLSRFHPWPIQLVVSRYTDYDIPVRVHYVLYTIYCPAYIAWIESHWHQRAKCFYRSLDCLKHYYISFWEAGVVQYAHWLRYGLDGYRQSGLGCQKEQIFFSAYRPDRFWGPFSLSSNPYRWIFPRGQSGR